MDIEQVVSKRIKGVVGRQMQNKAPKEQRDPLTAEQVGGLERLICTMETSPRQVVLGYLLFVLHTRCRFSDGLLVRREPRIDEVDGGIAFIEAESMKTKTNTMASGQRLMVPLVGLAKGVFDLPWARCWLQARADLGLPLSPLQLSVTENGTFGEGPMSTSEGTAWLRRFLELTLVHGQDGQRIGTHSLRTTLLSWAAKRGLSGGDR
eukprot:2011766-Amphidinium_carterae.1